jgi:NAD(P)-dependent dehydrogenase (short-subunit alcohol dehydrogenase family)
MLVATVLSGATQSVAAFGSPLLMMRADIMPSSLARGLARQKRAMMSSLLGRRVQGIRSAHVHMRSMAQDAKEPGSPPLVAVVTGAGKGLGYHVAHQLLRAGFFVVFGLHDRQDSESCQALHAKLALEGYKRQSLVLHLDVKRVKSISAAAVKIHESCPDGITVVVNNAAMHPDGFDYETAQEVLDVNFFGAQNVVRRMVPARWPEAITGRWLPAKSGFKGMRRGGVIVNIVCQTSLEPCDKRAEAAMPSGIQALYLDVRNKFESCSTETAIVMKVTEYLGHVAAGTHIDAGWPSNPYLVSKVCLGGCVFLFGRSKTSATMPRAVT